MIYTTDGLTVYPETPKSPNALKGVETDRNLMYLFWKKADTRKL